MKIILSFCFILLSFLSYSQDQYQNGFKEGFKNGYCYGEIAGCIAPIAPIGPVDLKMDYQTGYNNGFVAGKDEKNKQNKSNTSYSGGAYSQLKPTEQHNLAPITEAVNQFINNYDWEAYYERRKAKKELNDEKNQMIFDEYYKLSLKIDKLTKEYSQKNLFTEANQNKIQNIKNKSDALLNKYKNKPKKFTDFIYKITKLSLELNDVNYEIINSK